MSAPYTLFKRGKTWYVQFRDASGKRTTAKSTGYARKDGATTILKQGAGE